MADRLAGGVRRAEGAVHAGSAGSTWAGAGVAMVWGMGASSCCLVPRRGARTGFLAAPEDLDDTHGAAAAGAWLAQGERDGFGHRLGGCGRVFRAEQGADLRDVGLAAGTGQQTVVADAVETGGQDMEQEAADELAGGQPHDPLPVALLDAIVVPAEGDGSRVGADQAAVRDRHPVRVAAEIGQHGLGPSEGRFGVDDPFAFAERGEPGCEGVHLRQPFEIAEEGQLAGSVQIHQPFQKQASKQPRQNPHMQEEPRLAGDPPCAVGRQAAAGDDHVDVRMIGQRRSPGMKHAGHAHPRAHALGIGRDGHHCLRRGLEQQPIDRPLVPVGDLRNLGRQREDDVEILDGQQIFGARRHPVARGWSLTLRAVPVLAGVVGDMLVVARGTPGDMPAERFGSAGFDRRHHLELGQADMSGIGLPPRRTVGAEDISDLQPRPGHPAARSLQASLHRLILQPGQHLVGADGVADRLGGNMGISRGGRQLGMAEQHLDNAHVRVRLQKVGGNQRRHPSLLTGSHRRLKTMALTKASALICRRPDRIARPRARSNPRSDQSS